MNIKVKRALCWMFSVAMLASFAGCKKSPTEYSYYSYYDEDVDGSDENQSGTDNNSDAQN